MPAGFKLRGGVLVVLGLLVFLVAPRPGAAADAVAGRVTDVTLYRGQALVTRTVPLKAGQGSVEIVVGDLPEQIVQESLFAEGSDDVEVRAVRFRTRAVGEEPREEVRKLDEAIEAVQFKIAMNQKTIELLAKREAYLDKLEGFVAPTAKTELSKGVLDAEALERVTVFSFEQRTAIATEQLELAKEASELAKESSLLQRRRGELTNGSNRTVREAVLFLAKHGDAEQSVRLNYLVNNCGWAPTYTIRVGEDRAQSRVEYNALIQQLTGEDWTNVNLSLSTASPSLSASGPGLAPFHISLNEGTQQQEKQNVAQVDLGGQLRDIQLRQSYAITQNSIASDIRGNITASWDVNRAACEFQCIELTNGKEVLSTIDLANGGEEPSLIYGLAGAVSLASRSDQQMVRILQGDFASQFYHVATPVLTNYVYREADVTNSSDVDLLAGPITVYLDGRFVGRGEIPTVARGEAFVVGFGADPQLRARRELVDRNEGVQGGNRELSFDYRLVVENYKDEPTAIRVFDRLPYSGRKSEVRVTFEPTDDPPAEDTAATRRERLKGILRWDVEVPAVAVGEKAKLIDYSYTLEFDRKYILTASAATNQERQQEFERLFRSRLKR